MKVPAPPKCPNVDGEFVVPVQCGCLSPRISKPRPQGHGEIAADSRDDPAELGELDGRRLAAVACGDQRGGADLGEERDEVGGRAPHPMGRRAAAASVDVMPSGWSTASLEVVGERHAAASATACAAISMPVFE